MNEIQDALAALVDTIHDQTGGDDDFRVHLERALTSGINCVLVVHRLPTLDQKEEATR